MTNTKDRERICIVVSDSRTVCAFLREQVRSLMETHEVTVVANGDDNKLLRSLIPGGELIPVAISRQIDLWRDLRALASLYSLFRERKFALIHSITPKAGLLSMAAGKLARVPVRLHTFTGQVWATRSGVFRSLLKLADKLTASLATGVLADSRSQFEFMAAEGVVDVLRGRVLGSGSIGGVDASRFRPNAEARRGVRVEAGIPEDATIFLFVGRLNRDKGVLDLARAFTQVAGRRVNTYLVCVGPDEGGMEAAMRGICSSCQERVRILGETRFPERYMAAADVLCLPSYREGFGAVVIEAAACGIPAVASRIYGLTDAVEDGVTGCLHQPGNWMELAALMESLMDDCAWRLRIGQQAQVRATIDFSSQRLTAALTAFYEEQLANASLCAHWRLRVKRIFDVTLGGFALVMLAPILAMTAVVVRVSLGSPILFRQLRPGFQGKLFTCLKFRTMSDARGAAGQLLPDADRLTGVGNFLRRSSLDELPELVNVIRGEMSLVGPRPLLPDYLARYTPEQMRRHEMKPGITGWAQVNGRNALEWTEKFALDLWYVENWSLGLDLRILAKTLGQAVQRHEIAKNGHATMPEFLGAAGQQKAGNV